MTEAEDPTPADESSLKDDIERGMQVASMLAPIIQQVTKDFYEGRTQLAKETEKADITRAKISGMLIVAVVAIVATTACVSMFMILTFLGADEGGKFFTQISTLLGGVLGGLGLGVSLNGVVKRRR